MSDETRDETHDEQPAPPTPFPKLELIGEGTSCSLDGTCD
jgi:hypothetical protein